jgi:hypothetical protein
MNSEHTLYFSSPKHSDSIKRLCDFDYKRFIVLTAKNDVFSQEEVSSLWGTVTERDRQRELCITA